MQVTEQQYGELEKVYTLIGAVVMAMVVPMNVVKGRHFSRGIIPWAVRCYCKHGISYRELYEMLAERGVSVDHTTLYRQVQRYAPEMKKKAALVLAKPLRVLLLTSR